MSQLNINHPRTILTDKDDSLINSIQNIFPMADHLLCIWHVNMGIMGKIRPILQQEIARHQYESFESVRKDKAFSDKADER
jgi:hypothetical protein